MESASRDPWSSATYHSTQARSSQTPQHHRHHSRNTAPLSFGGQESSERQKQSSITSALEKANREPPPTVSASCYRGPGKGSQAPDPGCSGIHCLRPNPFSGDQSRSHQPSCQCDPQAYRQSQRQPNQYRSPSFHIPLPFPSQPMTELHKKEPGQAVCLSRFRDP